MADIMPDYHLEQQRLERRIKDHESRLEACKVQYLEASTTQKSALTNIAAHKAEIAEIRKNLTAMKKEHGPPIVDWDSLIEQELAEIKQEDTDG
jgi:chromosome segregation ATPase